MLLRLDVINVKAVDVCSTMPLCLAARRMLLMRNEVMLLRLACVNVCEIKLRQ